MGMGRYGKGITVRRNRATPAATRIEIGYRWMGKVGNRASGLATKQMLLLRRRMGVRDACAGVEGMNIDDDAIDHRSLDDGSVSDCSGWPGKSCSGSP